MLGALPALVDGTYARILASSDLGAATVPLRTSYGLSGTCAGIAAMLERERERLPTLWLDAGDLVVGSPAYPLVGERPWAEVRSLPIDVSVPGNRDPKPRQLGIPAREALAAALA